MSIYNIPSVITLTMRAPDLANHLDGKPVALLYNNHWHEVLDVFNDLNDVAAYCAMDVDDTVAHLETITTTNRRSLGFGSCLQLRDKISIKSIIRVMDHEHSNDGEIYDHFITVNKIQPLSVQFVTQTPVTTANPEV